MDLLKNNEIIDSINNDLKRRFSSPLYGTFIISWLMFNWEFIVTLFFVSEEKIWEKYGFLKSVYIKEEFFNYIDKPSLILFHYIFPIVSTFLIIWVTPKFLSIPAFRQGEKNRIKKKQITIQEELQLEVAKQELEKENIERLKITTQKIKKEQQVKKLDPSVIWEKEYNNFINSEFSKEFKYIPESIYEHSGKITIIGDFESRAFKIPTEVLIFSDTNGLVNLDHRTNKISLTEKGKFFVKKYSEREIS